jgi:hypothetical protein
MPLSREDAAAIVSTVRRNTIWAAGAAAIMLYFGLPPLLYEGAAPPEDLGQRVFLYTLQAGGAAMVLSALLSLTGQPFALMYDSIVSLGVAVAFVVCGVLLYAENGQQAVFNVLFAAVFAHTGYRNGREFSVMAAVDLTDTEPEAPEGEQHRGSAETEERDEHSMVVSAHGRTRR